MLDNYRAQVELDGIANMAFLNIFENQYIWDRRLPEQNVTAGKIYSLFADRLTYYNIDSNDLIACSDFNPDNKIYLLLDTQVSSPVNKINIINSFAYTSNYYSKKIQIRTAADETSPAFEPYEHTSYGVNLYDGNLLPLDINPGTERNADIINSTKRYFLIIFESNFWGPASQDNPCWLGDITIE